MIKIMKAILYTFITVIVLLLWLGSKSDHAPAKPPVYTQVELDEQARLAAYQAKREDEKQAKRKAAAELEATKAEVNKFKNVMGDYTRAVDGTSIFNVIGRSRKLCERVHTLITRDYNYTIADSFFRGHKYNDTIIHYNKEGQEVCATMALNGKTVVTDFVYNGKTYNGQEIDQAFAELKTAMR